eukprot:CAMPEP_0176025746 /NCGR_PEP_ID=MMETSP0120_2-20121206/12600_1 /TAXON_ID=160619 /ORGANISM="Kryptoperidinium foliaceum, Strain CCMP 1326" /LENGTH=661 /DNA_ID=CAMNT_0017358933 /DNA_START=70 /DNA_END=2055 /DNA_ORIENTATION=-
MDRKAAMVMKPKRASTLAQAMAKQAGLTNATSPTQESRQVRAHTFHGSPAVKGSPAAASPCSPDQPMSIGQESTNAGSPYSAMASPQAAGSPMMPGRSRTLASAMYRPPDLSGGADASRPTSSAPRFAARTSPNRGRGLGRTSPISKATTLPNALEEADSAARPQALRKGAVVPLGSRRTGGDVSEDGGGVTAVRTNDTCGTFGTMTSGQSLAFGIGERLEPTKWKRWSNKVDRLALSAHYEYIVGDLHSAFKVEDAEKAEHDDRMAAMLHKRHPDDPAHPLENEPVPVATCAFPDRAGRLREGRGAKSAMMPREEPPAEPEVHAACDCAVCSPFKQKAAGQPSHLVHSNRALRCSKDTHPDMSLGESQRSQLLFGSSLSKSLPHFEGNPNLPQDEEEAFHKAMGRKVKHATATSPGAGTSLMHRSFSVDNIRAAGGFNQALGGEICEHRSLRRQDWQGTRTSSPVRTGVALALSMREGDPPPPTRIVSVTKAPGVFRNMFSAESEKSTTYFNQDNFRFSDSAHVRGRSQPPPVLDREFAGSPTLECGTHSAWRRRDPLTANDGELKSPALGGSMSARAAPSFRKNLGNRSGLTSSMLNHELCDKYFAMETEYRMQTEPHFATLCAMSQDTKEWGKTMAHSFKTRNGRSGNIKEQLMWLES